MNPYKEEKNQRTFPYIKNYSVHCFSKESQLLSYVKKRAGFNPNYFINEIDLVFTNKPFHALSNNHLSIITQLVIYSQEEVYPYVLHKYGIHLSQKEIEDFIIPYSLQKNPIFLKETLPFYVKNFHLNQAFVQTLILKTCKTSYQDSNNHIIMDFLNSSEYPQEKYFFDTCITHRNIPLLKIALEYSHYQQFLQKNFSSYEKELKSLNCFHMIKKKLTQEKLLPPPSHIACAISSCPNVTIKKKRKFA